MSTHQIYYNNSNSVKNILESLWNGDKINMKRVKELAESDIDSEFFLRQFSDDPNIRKYHRKMYWQPLALVLIERGVPKSEKIKHDMLMWFQDSNWPGFNEIADLVMKNWKAFECVYKKTIEEAICINDSGWYCCLMYLLYQCSVGEDMEYLEIAKITKNINLIFNNKDIETINQLIEEWFSKIFKGA